MNCAQKKSARTVIRVSAVKKNIICQIQMVNEAWDRWKLLMSGGDVVASITTSYRSPGKITRVSIVIGSIGFLSVAITVMLWPLICKTKKLFWDIALLPENADE